MMRAAVRVLRLLPARIELEYLRAAQRQIHPLHPDVAFIALRINELEDIFHG
jgi:hypothetical protein